MKSVEEYYYTVYIYTLQYSCRYVSICKHVTTPGCQFYVDLYPPTLSLPKICILCYIRTILHFIQVANQ